MADTCEDCGRPFAADEAAFDAAGEHALCGMGPGCAGSAYHYDGFMLGACRVATIARLRAELAAAKEENERLDNAVFEANSRRLRIEADSFKLARMCLDALVAPPCECKGMGATVGPGGFMLCRRCAAEKEISKLGLLKGTEGTKP